MRKYLIGFFEEFGYDDKDARHLLRAYDTVTAGVTSFVLFNKALSAYESDISMDYKAEIFDRTRKISELTGVHDYTVELLIFMCMTKHLKEVYTEKCIDMRIYKDSVLDLKWKLEECKAVKGICGSFVSPWFCGFFDLTRFALGRLQESCPFVCYSWLLYPENKNILQPNTNTYRFMSEYDIIGWEVNNGEDLWRLFDTEEKNPDRLPADTSMRRCYIDHLKNGGRVGCGFGVKL